MQWDGRILGEGIAQAKITIVVHWQILAQRGVVREPRLAPDAAPTSHWSEVRLSLIVQVGFYFGGRLRPFQLLCQSFDAILFEIELLGSWWTNNHSGARSIIHRVCSYILVIIAPSAPLRAVLHRLLGRLHYASVFSIFPTLQIRPILSEEDVISEGLQG